MNDFYNATGAPSTDADLESEAVRDEFSDIGSGFDKMPTISGNGGKFIKVNSAGTALEASTSSTATTTDEGLVELATTAEANTGTDTSRVITPDALKDCQWTPTAVGRIYFPSGVDYEGYGISSVTNPSVGNLTVTFTDAAPDTNAQSAFVQADGSTGAQATSEVDMINTTTIDIDLFSGAGATTWPITHIVRWVYAD